MSSSDIETSDIEEPPPKPSTNADLRRTIGKAVLKSIMNSRLVSILSNIRLGRVSVCRRNAFKGLGASEEIEDEEWLPTKREGRERAQGLRRGLEAVGRYFAAILPAAWRGENGSTSVGDEPGLRARDDKLSEDEVGGYEMRGNSSICDRACRRIDVVRNIHWNGRIGVHVAQTPTH